MTPKQDSETNFTGEEVEYLKGNELVSGNDNGCIKHFYCKLWSVIIVVFLILLAYLVATNISM